MNNAARFGLAVGVLAVLGGAAACSRASASSSSGTPAGSGSAAPHGSAAPDARPVPVTTAVAEKKDVPVVLEGLGTVTPLATVTVKTLVDGRLERVAFKEGQDVKKGDLLALVDPRPFSIQLATAQASLARDKSNYDNSALNLDRYEKLRQQNLIPQQQVDDQRAAVAQLVAAQKADEAAISNAQLMLDYAHIVSPIDGTTGVRLVDPGNIVHPADQTGIVVVTQLDPIAVLFTLPQDDLARVQKAMKERKLGVEVFDRDGSTGLGKGELALLDNQVNAQTATIRLKAMLPNGDRALWPNEFVKARLSLETIGGALVVPAAAVQRGPKGTFVYVVNKDETASPKPVEVSSIEGDEAVIKTGIAPGDTVVTEGQNQLRPGAKVATRAPADKSGKPDAGAGRTTSVP